MAKQIKVHVDGHTVECLGLSTKEVVKELEKNYPKWQITYITRVSETETYVRLNRDSQEKSVSIIREF